MGLLAMNLGYSQFGGAFFGHKKTWNVERMLTAHQQAYQGPWLPVLTSCHFHCVQVHVYAGGRFYQGYKIQSLSKTLKCKFVRHVDNMFEFDASYDYGNVFYCFYFAHCDRKAEGDWGCRRLKLWWKPRAQLWYRQINHNQEESWIRTCSQRILEQLGDPSLYGILHQLRRQGHPRPHAT